MKNYPLWKSLIVFLVISSGIIFSIPSILYQEDTENWFLENKINLGLDLQGGSYLLLEIDNRPVITQKLQAKIIELKRYFKEKQIILKNFSLKGDTISFETTDNEIENVKNILNDKESDVNTYYPTYKSHEFDVLEDGNLFSLNYSRYGLVLLKNSSLDQAIEIVRRRVDEVGTNEPNILKRGNDRILGSFVPTSSTLLLTISIA